jgi:hypothetical protein
MTRKFLSLVLISAALICASCSSGENDTCFSGAYPGGCVGAPTGVEVDADSDVLVEEGGEDACDGCGTEDELDEISPLEGGFEDGFSEGSAAAEDVQGERIDGESGIDSGRDGTVDSAGSEAGACPPTQPTAGTTCAAGTAGPGGCTYVSATCACLSGEWACT